MPILSRALPHALLLLLLSSLAGCGEKPAQAQAPGGMPPPEVAVITVAADNVTVSTELPGRVEATRTAQVRARVPGIVQRRLFTEGSEVKAGDVLYQIDPAQYKASLASAEAALARAQANLSLTSAKLERYQPLVQTNAISKQEFDDVLGAQKQAAADVAAARASRESARLNLGYATVNAPISGRIGRALVTEGALVGQGEATPLAVVQQIDPIFVTMSQSSSEMQNLQRALADGRLKRLGKNAAQVTLVTEDGQKIGAPGKLLFAEMSVDESSGSVILRAQFPNTGRNLLPGMYVRARLEQAVREQSITVPQQAVQRSAEGPSVLLVQADGKVAKRPIKTEGTVGNQWIVSEGLKPGDRVIVEGLQKARPGAAVKVVDWQKPGTAAAKPAQASAPAASKPAASTR
jgi:membrane fusion protein (multidrug efflux system)